MSGDDPEKITLYVYVTSPYANKVACFLGYKGLSYDVVHVDFATLKELEFTGQGLLPVLKIGDEWRVDSTPIGLWLDEKFPDKPLISRIGSQRDLIMQIDQWVSDRVMPLIFREFAEIGWSHLPSWLYNRWRYGYGLYRARRFSRAMLMGWPLLVLKVPFVVRLAKMTDMTRSLEDNRASVCEELVTHLAGGPFLGGLSEPTLADLAAFPQIALPYVMGLKNWDTFTRYPEIVDWMNRVAGVLPPDPLLIPKDIIVKELPTAV